MMELEEVSKMERAEAKVSLIGRRVWTTTGGKKGREDRQVGDATRLRRENEGKSQR